MVTASADIDVSTAGQLRMALLDASRAGTATVVMDMRPRPCAEPGPFSGQPGDPANGGELVAEGMLRVSVRAGESGPVIVLAGEADLTCAEYLDALIAGQLAAGTRQLTVDVSGLRFADSATIRTLVLAARTLTERDGSLVLLDPQESVTRVLALLGADQMITIRRKIPTLEQAEPRPQAETTEPHS